MKKAFLWAVLDLIFLVVFNAFFFMLGGENHPVSVWISYAFIHFAYIMLLLTTFLVRKGESKHTYGALLFSISTYYFLAEFIVGVIFILVAPAGIKAAVLVQIAMAGIYGIMLMSNMIANENTADAQQARRVEIDYIKNASAKVASILDNVVDEDARKKIEKLYDAISTSPVKSHPDVAVLEEQISNSILHLEAFVSAGVYDKVEEQSDTIIKMIAERNRIMRTLN